MAALILSTAALAPAWVRMSMSAMPRARVGILDGDVELVEGVASVADLRVKSGAALLNGVGIPLTGCSIADRNTVLGGGGLQGVLAL